MYLFLVNNAMYQVSVYRPFPTQKVLVLDRLVKTGIGASLQYKLDNLNNCLIY